MATDAATLIALSSDISATVEAVDPHIVRVDARRRVDSSGFIWSDGLIVTASHTVERDDDIEVLFADGRTASATLAGRDTATDVALLRVEDMPARDARAAFDDVRVGSIVLAVGRDDDGIDASFGVVSALHGAWRTWRGGEIDRFVRLDVAVGPGKSGGALVPPGGGILGMVTWGLSRRSPLAIPNATLERVILTILEGRSSRRAFLGIAMQPVRLPRDHRERGESGVMITDLAPHGPAEHAGALLGDVIVAIDGENVADVHDLHRHLEAMSVGEEIRFSLIRANGLHDITIVVGEAPEDDDE